MCWRGIVPSHTIVIFKTFTFHVLVFPFLPAGGGKDGKALWMSFLSLTAPPPLCMIPLWGHTCDNAYTHRWHLIRCRPRSITNFCNWGLSWITGFYLWKLFMWCCCDFTHYPGIFPNCPSTHTYNTFSYQVPTGTCLKSAR